MLLIGIIIGIIITILSIPLYDLAIVSKSTINSLKQDEFQSRESVERLLQNNKELEFQVKTLNEVNRIQSEKLNPPRDDKGHYIRK